ncbi:unnamed protein product [Prorocentrum cordatum]|uniref:Uncharacterized protein n=1 Tax=Prorocentrum cordatum TaxID=2364126 RepID=A0ABN9WQ21_9DINO|nr:unnamed protein product [Polarella glacialis]
MAADVARGSARRLSAQGDAASECAELSFGVAAPGPGGESRRVSFASQAPPPPQAWTGRSEAVARRTWSSLTEQEILFTPRERRPSEPAGEAPPGALEAPAPVQRRKWASITEEAIGQGGCSRRGSAGLWGSPPSLGASQPQPEVLPAYGQPPRVEPAYPSQAYSPQQQQHQDHAEHIARRRWASMSEDDSASSQMHWALRQPHIQALRGGAPPPPSGYAMASHWQAPCGQPGAQAPCPRGPCPPSAGAIPPYSLQPPPFYAAPTPGCCGGVQHPGGYPPPPLPAGHWGAPSASSSRSAPAYGPWQMGPGGPHGQHGAQRQQPHAPAASSAWQGWEGASPGGGRHPGGAAWAHASAHGRPAKASLLWIGEGASHLWATWGRKISGRPAPRLPTGGAGAERIGLPIGLRRRQIHRFFDEQRGYSYTFKVFDWREARVVGAKFVRLDRPVAVDALTWDDLSDLELEALLIGVPAVCPHCDAGSLASVDYVSATLRSALGKGMPAGVACVKVSPALLARLADSCAEDTVIEFFDSAGGSARPDLLELADLAPRPDDWNAGVLLRPFAFPDPGMENDGVDAACEAAAQAWALRPRGACVAGRLDAEGGSAGRAARQGPAASGARRAATPRRINVSHYDLQSALGSFEQDLLKASAANCWALRECAGACPLVPSRSPFQSSPAAQLRAAAGPGEEGRPDLGALVEAGGRHADEAIQLATPQALEKATIAVTAACSFVAGFSHSLCGLGGSVLFTIGWSLSSEFGLVPRGIAAGIPFIMIHIAVVCPAIAWHLRELVPWRFCVLVATVWNLVYFVGSYLLRVVDGSAFKRGIGCVLFLIFTTQAAASILRVQALKDAVQNCCRRKKISLQSQSREEDRRRAGGDRAAAPEVRRGSSAALGALARERQQ